MIEALTCFLGMLATFLGWILACLIGAGVLPVSMLAAVLVMTVAGLGLMYSALILSE